MVRISPEQIKKLQKLLKEQTGKDYTEEETQQAGLNVMRFAVAKEQRRQELSAHYFRKEGLLLNDEQLRKQILPQLEASGIITQKTPRR